MHKQRPHIRWRKPWLVGNLIDEVALKHETYKQCSLVKTVLQHACKYLLQYHCCLQLCLPPPQGTSGSVHRLCRCSAEYWKTGISYRLEGLVAIWIVCEIIQCG